MQFPKIPEILIQDSHLLELPHELNQVEKYLEILNSNLKITNAGWKFNCKAVQSVPCLYYNDPVNIPPPPLIVGSDFSKIKAPSHQIQVSQFWNFVDQMTRPLTVSDLARLDTRPNRLFIPELGRHYSQKWAEEDALLYQGIYVQNEKDFIEMNDTVYPCKTLGPLAENLLACLVPETVLRVVPDSLMDHDAFVPPLDSTKNLMEIEDKIGKELGFLGVNIGNSLVNSSLGNQSSGDQIAAELGTLITEYESVSEINSQRKAKVSNIAKKWMAHQEYSSLLDELNKAIQSSYSKRQAAFKKAKKKNLGESRPIPDSLLALLKTRKRLISKIGNVFFKEKGKMPRLNESIFD